MIEVERNLFEQTFSPEESVAQHNSATPSSDEKTLTFVDLFAGIGGFHLAMHSVGAECVFASEWDKFARQTYEANFRPISPKLFREGHFAGDINKVNLEDIPSFDILCAGFPCQPFSYAGLNKGFEDATRGTLFFDVCRILDYHKPKMFLLENVKGLVSHDKGNTLKTILSQLSQLGYYVHWTVLSSLDFGLPQKRERWYCVGFNKNVPFKFPQGNKVQHVLRSIIELGETNPSLNLTDFEIKRIEYHFQQASLEERVMHDNSKYAKNTKKGKFGIFSYQKTDGSLRFHVGDKAKTQIQEAFYACLDTYAPTIIAGRVPKLWDIKRKLSVLEAKRLQGFPDDFLMPVSDSQAYKQLGNSISIPVVKAILTAMMESYKHFY